MVFVEGLVAYKGKWLMYYGQGDAGVGVLHGESRTGLRLSRGGVPPALELFLVLVRSRARRRTRTRSGPVTKAGKITNQTATAVIVYSSASLRANSVSMAGILLLGAAASARAAPELLDLVADLVVGDVAGGSRPMNRGIPRLS